MLSECPAHEDERADGVRLRCVHRGARYVLIYYDRPHGPDCPCDDHRPRAYVEYIDTESTVPCGFCMEGLYAFPAEAEAEWERMVARLRAGDPPRQGWCSCHAEPSCEGTG